MTDDWLETLETELSKPGFEERLKRFAKTRARVLAHYGRVDEGYARNLVQDAIDDTIMGVIAWDPQRVTLEKHLLDAIRSRIRHDCVRARKFRHHSEAALANVAAADAPDRRLELVSVAARVIAELCTLASEPPPPDHDVLRLLGAYRDEATKKIDVMQVSGLTSKRYEAARKRLNRLVLQLPTEVRDVVAARA